MKKTRQTTFTSNDKPTKENKEEDHLGAVFFFMKPGNKLAQGVQTKVLP